MPRLIRVMPGIGDNVWLCQKLINTGEKFDFHMSDGLPQRGKALFDLLPQVSASCTYVPGLRPKSVRETAKQYDGCAFASITEKAFSLELNHHLENGRRIEEYLPDLPTTYCLRYNTSDYAIAIDTVICNTFKPLPKLIGIYISAYSTNRAWNFWSEKEWFDLIQKIHLEIPDACFVFIGAEWDLDLTGNVIKLCQLHNIPLFDAVGMVLGASIELMKRLDYFIGFPSGMCIINETLHKKTFMFYPWHLKNMMYAWPEEDRIKNRDYIAQLFYTPMEAFRIIAEQTNLLS